MWRTRSAASCDAAARPATTIQRQREVLRTAHELGYFDYPKGANAGEVADELGIASSTLREHLAVAQRKLLAVVFEDGSVD